MTIWGELLRLYSLQRIVPSTIYRSISQTVQNLISQIAQNMEQWEREWPLWTPGLQNIFEYHIVAPRLVPPQMIPLDGHFEAKTRFSSHSLVLKKLNSTSSLGNMTIVVDGYAEVDHGLLHSWDIHHRWKKSSKRDVAGSTKSMQCWDPDGMTVPIFWSSCTKLR